MDIVVLKFGGSSLADDNAMKLAAHKVTSFLNKGKKVVVVVSAQGKMTNQLIEEAKTLNNNPSKRELDMLLSCGEQISCSKFALLLQEMGYRAISLTGWQAGIVTNSEYSEAKIEDIYPKRIWDEMEKNQVIVIAGFQGINRENDITTLGRDGSDTTAVALAAALEVNTCYIFSDVDGIYDKDPRKNKDAKKLEQVSYEQMYELVKSGAKVLHKRCIKIAQKYGITIVVASSFDNSEGSLVKNL